MEVNHRTYLLCVRHGVVCEVCRRKNLIKEQRAGAKHKQKENANKMLKESNKRFKPAELGDTVMIPIPDVDKGKIDQPNIPAVVISKDDHTGLFTLGTRHGRLDSQFSRNQFDPVGEQFINSSDVPNSEIGVREAARLQSRNGGQGVFKCICTTKCLTKKCKCKKANITCNSHCHKNMLW